MSWLARLTRPIRIFRAAREWMRVCECVRNGKYPQAEEHLDKMEALAGRVASQAEVMRALLISRDRNRHLSELKPAILRASQALEKDKALKGEDRRYLEGCVWVLAKPIASALSEEERRALKRDLRAIRLDDVSFYVRDNFKLLEQPHWS